MHRTHLLIFWHSVACDGHALPYDSLKCFLRLPRMSGSAKNVGSTTGDAFFFPHSFSQPAEFSIHIQDAPTSAVQMRNSKKRVFNGIPFKASTHAELEGLLTQNVLHPRTARGRPSLVRRAWSPVNFKARCVSFLRACGCGARLCLQDVNNDCYRKALEAV